MALETFSAICGMVSCLMLAFYSKDANFIVIWSLYLLSSSGMIYVGYARKSFNIVALMIVYTIINCIGLYNTVFF